jgi:hypothetical protein
MATASVELGTVKTIGANGQISLGKQYAGRHVLVYEQEPGVWLVKTATVIPDNERWLLDPKAVRDYQEGVAWAETHPASGENFEAVLDMLK